MGIADWGLGKRYYRRDAEPALLKLGPLKPTPAHPGFPLRGWMACRVRGGIRRPRDAEGWPRRSAALQRVEVWLDRCGKEDCSFTITFMFTNER